jgi:hypothetical protein
VSHDETLRWPTNLDRGGIEARLVRVRDAAKEQGLEHLASLFANPATMSAAQIGASVVGALEWLQKKPEHKDFTRQLEMVALNLKNLKT